MSLLKVTPQTRKLVEANAQKTCLGGVSRIFQGEERQERLWHDQLTGHLGEAALCKLITGNLEAYLRRYEVGRREREGDGGWDLEHEGRKYDVKTSYVTDPIGALKTHHLIVREKEWHPEVIYVLALTDHTYVKIAGWVKGAFIKQLGDPHRFKGAWAIPARKLQ